MNAAELLRAHLSQRREMGDLELVLDSLTHAQVLELLRRAGSAAGERAADASQAGAGAGSTAAVEGDLRPSQPDPIVRARQAVAPPTAASPALPDTVQLGDLAEIRTAALACTRCGLASKRRQVVFADGSETARLMVVGEAPGAEEDRTGRPFVGSAGQLLDLLLASVGFPRESVYICNVLKCRPPGNRDPQPDEIEACSPFLRHQLKLVAPDVILTVGTFSSQTLLGSRDPISRLRGQVHDFQGTPLIATYHPGALLRNPGWIRPVWEDLQRLRRLIDGEAARA